MAKNGKSKEAADSLYFIPCRVEPGMFKEEYLVYLEAFDPRSPGKPVRAQLLVDKREISTIQGTPKRNSPTPARLRVTRLKREGDWDVLILPQPCQPLGETILMPTGTATT